MPRFRKGTLDHDNDGRKGGSMPAKSTKVAKPATKKAASKASPAKAAVKAKQEAVADQFAAADARGEPQISVEDATLSRQIRGY